MAAVFSEYRKDVRGAAVENDESLLDLGDLGKGVGDCARATEKRKANTTARDADMMRKGGREGGERGRGGKWEQNNEKDGRRVDVA